MTPVGSFLICHSYVLQRKKRRNAISQNQLVQARINGEIKAQATAVLAEVGLTVSDAVRILLTKVAKEKMMPLELMTPNAATRAAMEEAKSGTLPRVHSVKALCEELNADD